MFPMIRKTIIPLIALRRPFLSSRLHVHFQSPMILTYNNKVLTSSSSRVHFSTASNNNNQQQLFLQVLDSQIQSAKRSVPTEPIDFPFETKLECDGGVTLKSEILGEKTEGWAYLDDENPLQRVLLHVEISKQNGSRSHMSINASADDIIIESMYIYRSPDHESHESVYELQFKMLSFEAQQGLNKFLGIRGINTNTVEFLHKYLTQNSNIFFLCKLHKFLTNL